MTYHGSNSHGAQCRSLFPDAPVCIMAGGLHCSHAHGRGMTEHLNGAVGIAGCSGLCRVGGAIQFRKASVSQGSIYHMSEGYKLCDPRMCGPRSCSSCDRRMTPRGPRSSWDEDSPQPTVSPSCHIYKVPTCSAEPMNTGVCAQTLTLSH